MTVVHSIQHHQARPRVSMTPSGRVKLSFGDTSVSLEFHEAMGLGQDLEAVRARAAVMDMKHEFVSTD